MEWPRLREEITTATSRVGELLRAMPAGDVPLARVSWTAAETGAHLVSLPGRYRRTVNEPQPLPNSLAADNERELAAVPERDPRALADLLTTEVAELLDMLGTDGQRTVYYFTIRHTAAGVGSIMLTELLVHGLDLARAIRRPWPITGSQAAACIRGILPALVLMVDPAAARAATGTYHLRVRGHQDWTIHIHDGAVTIEPGRPPRADVHFSADPTAFLLNSYGHLGSARAVLTGRLVAWGRKPWLVQRFARTFRET